MDTQTQITLSRLLSRLDAQQTPNTSYERTKQQRNIEHARTLLLTLEKQSAAVRVQSQRSELQADLQRKRETIKQLSARLQEAEQEDSEEEEEDDDEDSEAEDGQARNVSYEPARIDTASGLDTGQTPALQAEVLSQQAEAAQSQQPSELRSRKQPPTASTLQASDNRSAASTTAREQLFANRPKQDNLSKSETLLTHNRTEQENLTTSLLSLASALKSSSLQFSSSLESEKDVLKRAEGGLDKNAQGMEAAEKRMGALRRMSEGQGLWGRLKLYAMIFGLWVVVFLVVFVGPKLRL